MGIESMLLISTMCLINKPKIKQLAGQLTKRNITSDHFVKQSIYDYLNRP